LQEKVSTTSSEEYDDAKRLLFHELVSSTAGIAQRIVLKYSRAEDGRAAYLELLNKAESKRPSYISRLRRDLSNVEYGGEGASEIEDFILKIEDKVIIAVAAVNTWGSSNL